MSSSLKQAGFIIAVSLVSFVVTQTVGPRIVKAINNKIDSK